MYTPDDPQSIPGHDPGSYVAPATDPAIEAELAELRAYRQSAEGFLERLTPHQARIEKLLADEESGRVFDSSVGAFERMREERKPKLPPEWDPEQNPNLKRMMATADTVETWKTQQAKMEQDQAAEANQRVVSEAYTVAESLIKDNPQLADDNFAGIKAIAAYSGSEKLSFKDAADRLMPLLRPKAATPPRSLRASQGSPGVPQASEKPGDDARSLFEITKDRLQADRTKHRTA